MVSYWAQVSDAEIEVYESLADRTAEAWESIVDGLAEEERQPAARTTLLPPAVAL